MSQPCSDRQEFARIFCSTHLLRRRGIAEAAALHVFIGFRGGEFSTGEMGNFHSALTAVLPHVILLPNASSRMLLSLLQISFRTWLSG